MVMSDVILKLILSPIQELSQAQSSAEYPFPLT